MKVEELSVLLQLLSLRNIMKQDFVESQAEVVPIWCIPIQST
jgi:hypothetical protein